MAAEELDKTADRFKKDFDATLKADKTIDAATRQAELDRGRRPRADAEALASVVGDGRPASGEAKACSIARRDSRDVRGPHAVAGGADLMALSSPAFRKWRRRSGCPHAFRRPDLTSAELGFDVCRRPCPARIANGGGAPFRK